MILFWRNTSSELPPHPPEFTKGRRPGREKAQETQLIGGAEMAEVSRTGTIPSDNLQIHSSRFKLNIPVRVPVSQLGSNF